MMYSIHAAIHEFNRYSDLTMIVILVEEGGCVGEILLLFQAVRSTVHPVLDFTPA